MDYGILAQATTEAIPFLDFINLGVLAALVIAFLTKKVVPGWVLDKESKEKEEVKQELSKLREKLDDELLPTLWQTTDLLARVTEAMEKKSE